MLKNKDISKCKIGIITALPKEFAAMTSMLDTEEEYPIKNDPNDYVLGTIHDNLVPVTLLKKMGNNSAAYAAAHLLRSFPGISDVIMVGIAGGIPNPSDTSKHVRLGDVVVSNEYGVIQYDNIKLSKGVVKIRDTSSPPSAKLLGKVKFLESYRIRGKYPWEEHIKKAKNLENGQRPSPETDETFLWDSTIPQKHPEDTARRPGQPKIFYGRIGAANTLLKDINVRKKLKKELDITAVEMEGSGLSDGTWSSGRSYLLVRGICDYCAPDKSDTWQGYAAVTAAAYTRALLDLIFGESKKFKSVSLDINLCPFCGRHNKLINTFNCSACGKQYLCLEHKDTEFHHCVTCSSIERDRRQRAIFKEKIEKLVGQEFVWVRGGSFFMGDVFGDGADNEQPVHEVDIDDFWIGKYLVTQSQWLKIMDSNPSQFNNGSNYPVDSVTWNDAQKFIERLNNKWGKTVVRLPSEAEWEYAARSRGKTEKYSGGNDFDPVAWHANNSGGLTHPVGGKDANGLGLYDMSGNLHEWCQDTWHNNYQHAPLDGSAWLISSEESTHVLRGGSWANIYTYLRTTSRTKSEKSECSSNFGIRLVAAI